MATEAAAVALVAIDQSATPEDVVLRAGLDPSAITARFDSGFAVVASEAARERLAEDPAVAGVTDDHVVTTFEEVGDHLIQIGAPAAHAAGLQGAGVRVAVVDTGVDATHPDLAANVRSDLGVDCVDDGRSDDPHGHGTHVAGIVAAAANGQGALGVAPRAEIVPVRVLGAQGVGTGSSFACGLQHLLRLATDGDPANDVDVVNMSLGGQASSSPSQCGNDLVHGFVCQLVDAGVVVVAAAGNARQDAGLFVPARFPEVLTVSAFDGTTGSMAAFSNFGDAVDVAAPGVDIRSTYPNGAYQRMSGTSMAAPSVSGAAAVLLATRSRTVAETTDLLLQAGTCPDGGAAGSDRRCDGQGTWSDDGDARAEPLLHLGSAILDVTPGNRILAPREGELVGDIVQVVVQAPSPVDQVRVRVNSGTWQTTARAEPDRWVMSWNTLSLAPGNHSLTVELSGPGVAPRTLTRTVRVTHSPLLRITSPAPERVVAGGVGLVVDASSPTGSPVAVSWTTVSAGGVLTPVGGTRFAGLWDSRTTADGPTMVTIRAEDAAGRETTTVVPVVVDNAPKVQLISRVLRGRARLEVAAGSLSASGSDVTVTATIDPPGGTGPLALPFDGTWHSTIVDVRGLAHGLHPIELRAVDHQGRQRVFETEVFVDSAPGLAVVSPFADQVTGGIVTVRAFLTPTNGAAADATVVLRAGAVVGGMAYDTASGEHRISVDTRRFDDGTLPIEISATDAAGVTATAASTITVRNRPGFYQPCVPADGEVGGVTDVLVYADDSATPMAQLVVTARAGSGPTEPVPYDPGSAAHRWRWHAGSLPSGPVDVTFTVTDGDGQFSTQVRHFVVRSGPSLSLFAPDGQEFDTTVQVGAEATSPGYAAAALRVTASIDGAPGEALAHQTGSLGTFWAWPSTYHLEDGEHEVVVRVVDPAGRSAEARRTFRVNHRPQVRLDPIPVLAGSAEVLVSAYSSRFDHQIAVDVAIGTAHYPAAWDARRFVYVARVDTTSFPDGGYTVRATATDPAGRVAVTTGWAAIGNAPIAGFAFSSSDRYGGRLLLCFQAVDRSDARGTLAVGFRIDGGPRRSTTYDGRAAPPLNCAWVDTAPLADGAHSVEVTAADPSGRTGSATQPLLVDNTLLVEVPPPTTITAGSGTFEARVSRAGGSTGDLTVTVAIDGGASLPMTAPFGDARWRVALPSSVRAGSHSMVVAAVDSHTGRTASAAGEIVVVAPPVTTPPPVVVPPTSPYLTLGPWSSQGGSIAGTPAATSAAPYSATLFVRGIDDQLWTRVVGAGATPYRPLGGRITDGVAASTGGSSVTAFVRGADGALWEHHCTRPGSCGVWSSLGGAIRGAPATASMGDRTDVFVRGADDQLWQRTKTGSTWGPWTPLGGRLTSGPAATRTEAGDLVVSARGLDGAVWLRYFIGGRWGPWVTLGGRIIDQPALVTTADGNLHVMVRGLDDALWETVCPPGGRCSAFHRHGGVLTAAPSLTTIATSTRPVTYVIARGADGAPWAAVSLAA